MAGPGEQVQLFLERTVSAAPDWRCVGTERRRYRKSDGGCHLGIGSLDTTIHVTRVPRAHVEDLNNVTDGWGIVGGEFFECFRRNCHGKSGEPSLQNWGSFRPPCCCERCGTKKVLPAATAVWIAERSDIRKNLVIKLGVTFAFIGGQKLDCRSRVKIHLARDVVGD